MDMIARIRQEIERLYDGEAPKHDQQCDFSDGYFTALSRIDEFLDTLESEKPINLEEELKKEIEKKYDQAKWGYVDGFGAVVMDKGQFIRIACHFAQWGAEHLKK